MKKVVTDKALTILKAFWYDPWRLAGNRNKDLRQVLYSELLGRKTTKAESGITALRDVLVELSGVTGSCHAVQDRNLVEWLKNQWV